MIANWLPNNVPKLSTILYSAGLMVPWLLPDRAAAHDYEYKYPYSETDCVFPNQSQAEGTALRAIRKECSGDGGTLVNNRAWGGMCQVTNPETGQIQYKYWGAAQGTCKIPVGPHTHDKVTEEDCDCGNCGDGCDS